MYNIIHHFCYGKTGLGLDKISLSALIISLGILVDNSIVVAEGILGQIKDSIQNGVNKVQKSYADCNWGYTKISSTAAVCLNYHFMCVFAGLSC